MDICKQLKKNSDLVIGVLALLVLGYALWSYSNKKLMPASSMKNHLSSASYGNNGSSSSLNSHFSGVSDVNSSVNNMMHLKKESVDPSELLPRDNNNDYAKMNPTSSLQGINMLTPSANAFDSLSSTMSTNRNPNLQLRSEPPNPQNVVCAWNQTTMAPDASRRKLEIGN